MQDTIKLLKNCTILYVENDCKTSKSVLKLYNAIFKKVYFTDNANEAIGLFKKHHKEIDLTIAEANMPIMTGTQMATKIREDYGYKHPILFTMHKDSKIDFFKGIKLGIIDYIIKPVLHQTHLGILINVLKPIHETKMLYLMNQELEVYKDSANKQLLISKTDLNGIITYANDNFCKVSKFSEDELIGNSHNIVRHPNTKGEVFDKLWATIKKGEIWSGTVENRAKDGTSYYVEAKVLPIKNTKGNICEYLSLRQNITKHIKLNNKAKLELKKTKLNYSKIYEDSVYKAKISVAKELRDLEFIINHEKENSKNHRSKRVIAETKLNETITLKNKEIEKWKKIVKKSSTSLENIGQTNKKLTNDSRKFYLNLSQKDDEIKITQKKIFQLQNDKEKLEKTIVNRADVITHLEEELFLIKQKIQH